MAKIITPDYQLDIQYAPFENMTDEEFYHFCVQNRKVPIERDENHQILFMPPSDSVYDHKNGDLITDLFNWNRKYKLGITFGSSAGFYLPDGSMRSPDAAWISHERWNALPVEKQVGFAYITPDFVVELALPSDSIAQLKIKMEKWRDNGATLGWLIIPKTEIVFIYRADGTISKVEGFDNVLNGEDVLPGFELGLQILR
jgi:Uma2 family endonuclease